MPVHIRPLQYHAECNTFPEWITLFTLCLAPLIAHVISGTAPVSYLAHSRPKWLDTLCHYNPTSIIWRYAAIADRRLRTTRWGPNELAATNAIFWTTNGWNGDESMVTSAMPYCMQDPGSSHVKVFSITMLKTIVVTLQGVSALYSLIGGLAGTTVFYPFSTMGMDMIFFPLAILGLVRLCAAAWLTEDFAYIYSIKLAHKSSARNGTVSEVGLPLNQIYDDFDPWLITPTKISADFQVPNSSWTSCAFRVIYLSICIGLWGLPLLAIIPQPGQSVVFSVTFLLASLFYVTFLTISNIIYAVYFILGKTTTTIIPCIASMWYKIYTIMFMVTMLLLITISAIETSRRPDGMYKSIPTDLQVDCGSRLTWWAVSPKNFFSALSSSGLKKTTRPEGTTTMLPAVEVLDNVIVSSDNHSLYSFTGWCVGQIGDT